MARPARWLFPDLDRGAVETLSRELGIGLPVAGVLYGRFLGLDYIASANAGALLASFNIETALGATFPPEETSGLADRLIESLRESGIDV